MFLVLLQPFCSGINYRPLGFSPVQDTEFLPDQFGQTKGEKKQAKGRKLEFSTQDPGKKTNHPPTLVLGGNRALGFRDSRLVVQQTFLLQVICEYQV